MTNTDPAINSMRAQWGAGDGLKMELTRNGAKTQYRVIQTICNIKVAT